MHPISMVPPPMRRESGFVLYLGNGIPVPLSLNRFLHRLDDIKLFHQAMFCSALYRFRMNITINQISTERCGSQFKR